MDNAGLELRRTVWAGGSEGVPGGCEGVTGGGEGVTRGSEGVTGDSEGASGGSGRVARVYAAPEVMGRLRPPEGEQSETGGQLGLHCRGG